MHPDLVTTMAAFDWHRTEDDVSLSFDIESVPKPPAELATTHAVARWGQRHYGNSVHVDHVSLYCTREVFRALGMLTIAAALHAPAEPLIVHLLHPASAIPRRVVFGWGVDSIGTSTLISRLEKFLYTPRVLQRHPQLHEGISASHMPELGRHGDDGALCWAGQGNVQASYF